MCPHYNVQVVRERPDECVNKLCTEIFTGKKSYAIDGIVKIAINKLTRS